MYVCSDVLGLSETPRLGDSGATPSRLVIPSHMRLLAHSRSRRAQRAEEAAATRSREPSVGKSGAA